MKQKPEKRSEFRRKINDSLRRAVERKPDLIALQEIVQYGDASEPEELFDKLEDYYYKPSIAIDSRRHTHPYKWQQFRKEGDWSETDYLGLGSAILWRRDIPHGPIWDSANPKLDEKIQTEEVHLDTGLYTGDRDTEPRLAVVAHFIFQDGQTPFDVFLVNLHLTTLKGEREGKPERDDLGARFRMAQIDTVLHGIVSRYNEWRGNLKGSRIPAVWILAGDFNCTPESLEIAKLNRMNFQDLIPEKGAGTKASGYTSKPTITLDYIFAGPKYIALDPIIIDHEIKSNPKPMTEYSGSDHFPIFATLPVLVDSLKAKKNR